MPVLNYSFIGSFFDTVGPKLLVCPRWITVGASDCPKDLTNIRNTHIVKQLQDLIAVLEHANKYSTGKHYHEVLRDAE